ncbi:MAG: dephospho-CoA kinase [Candidatus Aquicultor secundus]|uniref:Dephospho-CoA kinase n=3 Tax=Candidatus Aquicultor secundus TaxID=1973895 RepID=A0A2M7T9X5_9ACTN|nr:dephospho-CoA kinase [Candidatus Aquicultor secundus]NCO65414.1 dephospho-CoA kinase [Solirubrobacter sp.]OIO87073.1 MAG: dephospho-CoA kinase [Candidatus Aquicultor secundus]PIU27735.1 MAG: dephospho-CoA kinase [Candidatus Aquicultor secundus]PIX52910.1 MAG: dephospho-CoA kinase [Candidatus Aquicultor secundus]PIZ41656.1 MAG: dephospho-CoA kinase [Candidatus Aquicultor secundus]
MKLIGITGAIGSGKSTVALLLKEKSAIVIDADKVAREVVEPKKPAWKQIVDHFGEGILLPDGEINRRELGKRVFGHPEKLARLNEIIHPHAIAEIDRRVEQLESEFKNGQAVVIDVPLLFEAGMHTRCDLTVAVIANSEIRRERLLERGMSRSEIERRMESQEGKDILEQQADVVIENNGTLAELKEKVNELWKRIQNH